MTPCTCCGTATPTPGLCWGCGGNVCLPADPWGERVLEILASPEPAAESDLVGWATARAGTIWEIVGRDEVSDVVE